ncbi:hypothetical protein WCP94_004021 [Bilophila wadsworthia]
MLQTGRGIIPAIPVPHVECVASRHLRHPATIRRIPFRCAQKNHINRFMSSIITDIIKNIFYEFIFEFDLLTSFHHIN